MFTDLELRQYPTLSFYTDLQLAEYVFYTNKHTSRIKISAVWEKKICSAGDIHSYQRTAPTFIKVGSKIYNKFWA